MSKFSPGPWKEDGHRIYQKIKGKPGPEEQIAMVFFKQTVAIQHANARLIAAAPEMLEALKYAQTWLGSSHNEQEEKLGHILDRAIAKAEKQ